MEQVACLLCSHEEQRVWLHGSDRQYPLPERFTLVECSHCGFLYLSPRPDPSEIGRYYPSEYGAYQYTAESHNGQFVDQMRQYDLQKRCETVLRYRSSGDLLDIGCGSGDYLAAMQEHSGWCVRGLEPFAPAVAEQARERYGITVDEVSLEDAPYPNCSFDVVTLWEVLEHLPQPVDALRRIHALLRPGGLLILSLPNRDSFAAHVFGSSWCGLDIPRHFSVFSPSHIQQALSAAGFARPEIFAERGILGAAQFEFFSSLLSFYMWIHGEEGRPIRGRAFALSAFERTVRKPAAIAALFLLMLPYSILARKLNRGSQMVVVARRE